MRDRYKNIKANVKSISPTEYIDKVAGCTLDEQEFFYKELYKKIIKLEQKDREYYNEQEYNYDI